MTIDFNLLVGGEAGQGIQSTGYLLAKTFSRGGYHVFADQDYESRIRGGHNFFRIRIKEKEVNAISEKVNMLLAFDNSTIKLHESEVVVDGLIIVDRSLEQLIHDNRRVFTIPLIQLAEQTTGNRIMANSVALGVVIGVLNFNFEILSDVLKGHFIDSETGLNNIRAARAGFEYAMRNFNPNYFQKVTPIEHIKRMLISGNEAISLGAIAADCKFMAAYPMTPSTPIMEYLAEKGERLGIIVIQPEDEISAVNMVVGAAFAGVRAMTATSGSGFCLMIEGLGLAGITETPIVIVDGQRPGPAVGLPTRTEQGDLLFAIHAHHGDFPRAVFAPSTVEEAFWITVKAFNIAEKYQIPVIILNDHHLATSYITVDKFDLSKVILDRGILYQSDENSDVTEYKRHLVTDDGISPRAFPGQRNILVATDADEHDESGHLIEDANIRVEQVRKRLRKIERIKREISLPRQFGSKEADNIIIGWGSTYGAIREAVDTMLKDGISISMLHLSEIYPFPTDYVIKEMDGVANCFVVENNATGQLARLIKQETGKSVNNKVLKFDGRPFTPREVIKEVIKSV